MKFDPYMYRYPSRRNLVFGKNGVVASASPLASQAGLDILKKGGNAVDAAVATATALTVVEPSGNGIGGDCFAIIWYEGKIYGINASGFAPENISREELLEKGEEISLYGLDSLTVPGAPGGWAALSERFGNLSLSEAVEPAATIAEEGFPVATNVAALWKRYYGIYSAQLEKYPVLKTWFETYCPDGRPLKAGELFKAPNHAKTLREIGRTNAESFYKGEIAEAIDAFSRENGGYLRKEDLAKYQPEWVKPLSTNYKGYDVWQLPPNGIGVIVLMALNNLEQMELKGKEDVETYHAQIEALKLAFEDGLEFIGDPLDEGLNVDLEQLLSKEWAKERTSQITDEAMDPKPGNLPSSGTVYFSVADKDGNMVSFIQSCYTGFGSGAVVPDYGISLHNRGNQFSLKKDHPNEIKPGKRPYHTIIPGFLSQDGKAVGPFGVMGGPLQPQAHMQVVSSMVDFHLNPQEAIDAPRWQWTSGKSVQLEPSFPFHIAEALKRRGHNIQLLNETIMIGRGQIILQQDDGVYVAATEGRTDGYIAVW